MQKRYIGIGYATVATRGDVLWLSLARNIGVARAVAALLTSKIVEFATTIILNPLHRPNLHSRKNIGNVIDS